jgi:hypothetical protein
LAEFPARKTPANYLAGESQQQVLPCQKISAAILPCQKKIWQITPCQNRPASFACREITPATSSLPGKRPAQFIRRESCGR